MVATFLYFRRKTRKGISDLKIATHTETYEEGPGLSCCVTKNLLIFIDPLDSFELPPNFITREAQIGQGEFGNVYRGAIYKDRKSQSVALKYLKDNAGVIDRESFKREARQSAGLSHENIVRLIAVVFRAEPLLIAMELMHNGDLRTYLRFCASRHYGKLRTTQLLKLSLDIARGVDYLHKRSFVHRDIALRNVLLSDSYVAKVSDFGLSHSFDLGGVF
jgi:serine/threonine protein kinase